MPTRHPRTNLPPAGHTRDEILRARTDSLEEQAATQFADVGTIDPSKLEIDREAADVYVRTDGYEVKNAVAGFVYCWVREDKPGSQIQWKRAQRVQMPDGDFVPLWEVVQSDMPEAPEEKDARGYRKIVDCILMRARADRFRQYQIEQATRRQHMEQGTTGELEDLARRSKGMVKVYSETDMSGQKTTLDRAMATGMARNQFNKKLREGTAHQV